MGRDPYLSVLAKRADDGCHYIAEHTDQKLHYAAMPLFE